MHDKPSIAQPYTADIAESKTQQARSSGKFCVMSVQAISPNTAESPSVAASSQPRNRPNRPAGRRSISAANNTFAASIPPIKCIQLNWFRL